MSDTKTNWILELIDKISGPMRKVSESVNTADHFVDALEHSINQMGTTAPTSVNKVVQGVEKANKSLSLIAVQAGATALQNLGQPFIDGAAGTYKYDSSLRELQAITGITAEAVEDIGSKARASAKDFGGDAAASVNLYTVLLSKLTPEIAKNPAALEMMGTSVQKLGITMKGDLDGATRAASSAMNQFGVDLSNPITAAREMDVMLNIMTASAKVGSQEVTQVAQALDASGAMAKQANVSFSETNAALQVLGKYGKEGAEGGVALRNVLAIMGKGEFIPDEVKEQLIAAGVDINTLSDKTKSFADRITELKKLGGNDALIGKMFGMENAVAITGLLGNVDLLKQYTADISKDTNALNDMAATMGDSYANQRKKIVSSFEDIKISLYEATGAALPFIDVFGGGLLSAISLAPGIMATVQMIQALSKAQWVATVATKIATGAQWLWNLALTANPIGLIVVGIAAAVAAIVWAYNEFDNFRALIDGLFETFKVVFDGIYRYIMLILAPIRLLIGFLTGGKEGFLAAKAAISNDAVKLVNDVKDVGTGDAFKRGQINSWAKSSEGENDKKQSGVDATVKPEGGIPPVVPPNKGPELSIGGAGSAKSISVSMEIKNYFNNIKSDMDVEKIASKISGVINDRLRDTIINAG